MNRIGRISTALAVAFAVALGGAGSAVAKHGADDPPGHHRKHHKKHHHAGEDNHKKHGADDGPNHT